jgi:type IV pilus assembly protein PilM
MISFLKNRYSPIGVDIGSHTVKLLQLNGDRTGVLQAARWDLVDPAGKPRDPDHPDDLAEALRKALDSRRFHGRDAVVCLGSRQLFVQNLRVPKSPDGNLHVAVRQEAEGKLPFPLDEADLRYLEAGDVRQGDTTRREVILMACHRKRLEEYLKPVIAAGLRPVAVDAEPTALLRCYSHQFRRVEDQDQSMMHVHIGASKTAVVIAHESSPLFVKYLDLGGSHMDEAVAFGLDMERPAAAMLRLHNGDRRRDQQDPEIRTSIAHALRPVCDRLASELSLCIRYYSVTFRSKPLSRIVIGGGEANQELVQWLSDRLNLPCEIAMPFRGMKSDGETRRQTQWSVATGLALWEVT